LRDPVFTDAAHAHEKDRIRATPEGKKELVGFTDGVREGGIVARAAARSQAPRSLGCS